MKAFGLLSLILALLIVAVLAKKQLIATHQAAPGAASQAASMTTDGQPRVGRSDDVRRLQDQVKDEVNQAVQQQASQVNQGLNEVDKP